MDTTAREWIVSQGHRTVPQIYYNQQLFVDGGFQGLSKMVPDQIQQRIGALNVST
jgi:glutaredoxin